MTLHKSTFEYLKPSDGQVEVMNALREISNDYRSVSRPYWVTEYLRAMEAATS